MKIPDTMKKTALAAAVAAGMGVSANAEALTVNMEFSGWWTWMGSNGGFIVNNDASLNAFSGYRTEITGTGLYDTITGTGSIDVVPFSYGGGGAATHTSISLQSVGSNLILGNTSYTWNTTTGIPVSVVFDASGFLGAIGAGVATSDVLTAGATSAAQLPTRVPNLTGPIVTTTLNTTTIGTPTTGAFNPPPSGTQPFTTDGIAGSPMTTTPFPNFNIAFDFTTLHVTSVSAVPVPAAVWLFGSGLLGLVGVARRRKS